MENGKESNRWEVFNKINAPLLTTTEYFPALGNHELDSELYFKNFPIIKNQRWYSVDREGIHFIILDSNSNLKEGSEQYRWLESDLKELSDDIKFRIVILHHPLINLGPHGEDEKGLRPALLPLFEKYGVCAVFSGHDHNYQRFEYDGIDFIVTGGGGSHLTDRVRTSPYLKAYKKTYHFCLLTPEGDSLKVKVIDVDSNVIDEFTIFPKVVSAVEQN